MACNPYGANTEIVIDCCTLSIRDTDLDCTVQTLNLLDTDISKNSTTVTFSDGVNSFSLHIDVIESMIPIADIEQAIKDCRCALTDMQQELEYVGVTVAPYCRLSDNKLVNVRICKLEDGTIEIKDTDSNLIITEAELASGYDVDCLPEKSSLEPYFDTIIDDSKYIFTPSVAVDKIKVAVNDPDRCNYLRITFECPDGTLGCTLITPFEPMRSISLPNSAEVTDICIEVVDKTPGVDVKAWATVAPTTDIDVNIDGLNI